MSGCALLITGSTALRPTPRPAWPSAITCPGRSRQRTRLSGIGPPLAPVREPRAIGGGQVHRWQQGLVEPNVAIEAGEPAALPQVPHAELR